MKNTAIRTIATAALAIALAGCGAGSASTGTSSTGDKVIKVGATAVPHAEILNDVVKDVLADAGWTLEVTEFTDYVTPNTALEDGSLDANYFQTLGYMNNQNDENGLPNFDSIRACFDQVEAIIRDNRAAAIWAVDFGGVAEGIAMMISCTCNSSTFSRMSLRSPTTFAPCM